MGNAITKQELLNSANALKIKGHYKEDICKNGWVYIVVMTNKKREISFQNSMN